MEKTYNKFRTSFKHKGETYEIDELMDASGRGAGFGTYDIFCGKACVGQITASINEAPDALKELAKKELGL